MRFKEWLLLSEGQWVSLGRPTIINGIKCDKIDFRFEDYSIDGKYGLQFLQGSFSAPLQDSRWLNYSEFKMPDNPDLDFDTWKAMKQRGEKISLGGVPKGQVNVMEQPLYPAERHLPEDWADYAIFYMGEAMVSEPKYPRSDYERIRKDVPLGPEKQTLPAGSPEPIFNQ